MQPYWYELSEQKIATRPVVPYHDAKMLVVDRKEKTLKDCVFKDLSELLNSSYHLVLNNTKVIKARLIGKLPTGGEVEIFLVREIKEDIWEALGKPMKKLKPGTTVQFSNNLFCTILEKKSPEYVEIEFKAAGEDTFKILEEIGSMPIPPYIRKGQGDLQDIKDYQTCFAEIPGSIAAPTASLHLTPEVLKNLTNKSIAIDYLTLHLGPASFKPVLEDPNSDYRKPGKEKLIYNHRLPRMIESVRANGRKVLSVGTSVVRALESIALGYNTETDLFITPGFEFKITDALITNFHQPGTTHLLLVEAFLGKELLEKSYGHALKNNYRFLSYGDGMLIL